MLAIALAAALYLVVTAPVALAVRHFHSTKPSIRRTVGIAYVWGLGIGCFYAVNAAGGFSGEVGLLGLLAALAAVATPAAVSYFAWKAPAATVTTPPQQR